MSRHRLRRSALFLTVALAGLLVPWSARAQQADGPMRAFRRQAQADAAEKARVFERLKENAPVPQQGPRPRNITLEEPAEDEEGPADAPPAPIRRILARDNFDRCVFGDVDESARLERLETMLVEQIERAARHNRLTAVQQARLRLAGQGDLKRFFDRVEAKRAEFELIRGDLRAGVRLLQELYPEHRDYQDGPFGRGSLYDKMLTKILGEDPNRGRPIPTILDR
ncbi:MAG TPA: hypothetical protein VGH33_22700 [Isosphaeraceae bacterium]